MSSGFPPNNPFGEAPNNPYASPQFTGTAFPPGMMPPHIAEAKVKLPAIFLMCVAPLGILFVIFDFAARIANNGQVPNFGADPNAAGFKEGAIIGNYIGMVFDFAVLAMQVAVIIGAYNMLKLQNRMSAMTASIISVIPCFSACCVLGIPFGIWALVVLNDPGVKANFKS